MRKSNGTSKRRAREKNVRAEGSYTIPIIARLQTFGPWDVEVSEGLNPEFTYKWGPPMTEEAGGRSRSWKPEIQCGAFEVRQRVFAVSDVKGAIDLFRDFGPWREKTERITYNALIRQRDFFRNALLGTAANATWGQSGSDEDLRAWMDHHRVFGPLQLELLFLDPLRGQVRCKDIEQCLRASVFLERANRFKWRCCKREDCGKAFRLTPYRTHYCSDRCSHLQAVRDSNLRRAKPTKTGARKGKV